MAYRNVFLSASVDKSVRLWDVRTESCLFTFSELHSSDVNDVDWLGRKRYEGFTPSFVEKASESEEKGKEKESKGCFASGMYSFVSGGEDSILKISDIRSLRQLQSYGGKKDSTFGELPGASGMGILHTLFSPSGQYIFVGWNEPLGGKGMPSGTLTVLDVIKGKLIDCGLHNLEVRCSTEVAPNGEYFATAGWDRILRMWV